MRVACMRADHKLRDKSRGYSQSASVGKAHLYSSQHEHRQAYEQKDAPGMPPLSWQPCMGHAVQRCWQYRQQHCCSTAIQLALDAPVCCPATSCTSPAAWPAQTDSLSTLLHVRPNPYMTPCSVVHYRICPLPSCIRHMPDASPQMLVVALK